MFQFADSIHLRWQDIVDIIIVSYLLYRAFLLIKGTLAVQMLIGLSILFFALKLSQFLQLRTLFWLLQNFWTIWVLALIVLFQPEIRRALVQISPRGFFQRKSLAESETIDEIAEAVDTFVKEHTGALLVFERETGLRTFTEIGVLVDAIVTRDLIRSIFNTRSPLHDGAVIIQKGRIAAATCFLPLSKNPEIDLALGTRHRAGIGITEDTDAASVIVSEETGGISFALRGRLTKNLDNNSLKRVLRRVLRVKDEKTTR
ncbi:MAG: TIGR00159 family protein [Candidatus Schekmanbacteria bacterium RBG_13_48_7]|uniref:Diadenylate cyclase n=1 Tax=Candidatus Schekmanbacteria bacterium RBG_13_48_7 TaxID=1817878 RepID=A0A1F7RY89_9BACT|nr:MAG: TIGR00159 family protein [Candidatus Schekmanbacteria bacterium RBG_13_48_7]